MPRRLLIAATALVAFLATAPPARADWVWPVQGEVITTYRNGPDPYAAGQHRGIDIAAPVGTPVVAAAGGEVRFAGPAGSSGLTVSIRTADGRFDTSYLHLSSAAVHEGDRVATGDRVGAAGTTGGRSAEAPHLHFGVRDAGTDHGYRDPLSLLPPPGAPAELPRPMPAPAELPRPMLAPAELPRAAPALAERPRPAPAPVPTPRPLPALGPRPSRAPAATPPPALAPLPTVEPRPSSPAARGSAGPDLGYALAVVGLLVAAALLGLREDGRRAARRGTVRVAGALRPLLPRRS